MKKIILHRFVYSFILLFVSFSTNAFCQENSYSLTDSFTVDKIIQVTVENHPSVKQAEEALNTADARIGLAKSGYYPDIDATASFSRIGPVPAINFPSLGEFKLYPENNYNASVNIRQTLYDFGKTSGTVKLANESKNLYNQQISLVKQKLALASVNAYYSIVFLEEAIHIKEKQLETLKNHIAFLEKKMETGSATQFEVLSTNVRVSYVANQKIDLETYLKIQFSVLNSLMGLPVTNQTRVVRDSLVVFKNIVDTTKLDAMGNRIEMSIAKERESQAELQYQVVKTQNNPVVSAFASGGGKNGYVPELDKFKANYTIGVGLRIPLFDANRLKYNLLQAKSASMSTHYETEITQRAISAEIVESELSSKAAGIKISQVELQLEQSEQAFKLAKVSFIAGTITNLDLLDAETTVSESRLQLLKTRVDYIISIYKLKAAIGEKLY